MSGPVPTPTLDEAWAEVEAAAEALGDWQFDGIQRGNDKPWVAVAYGPVDSDAGNFPELIVEGDTPAAALHALAERLRGLG